MGDGNTKRRRVLAALEGREPDRVPIGEFFWSQFVRRAREEWAGGGAFNPYTHWDLDLIVVNPNMDPHLTGIQVIEDSGAHKVVKTGFGATIELRDTCPMPSFLDFETKTYEQMEAFRFDDPRDPRRYFEALDDQLNSVGDALNLGLPSFVDRVNACADDFCVFGGICEPHEMIWRMMGTENVLLKIGEDPGRVASFLERIGDFMVGIAESQIAAAGGKLSGLYLWGDIAYDRGMFFSPDYWRSAYKPQVARLCATAHKAGIKVIYHGCGNASAVFEDLIEAGVDAYNPLEAKAGLDVVELKRRFGRRWAFNGNIDVRVLATNNRDAIRREVLTKLNAAKGGGYIVQSDHSVPDNVDPASYDYMVQLVRQYGVYPLHLDEYDIPMS
ncbi:MAG TPA: uroporphyrinogen decarboxylase family protein [Candidatus Hydrogenedentes bacterium]|nr:uroporphyrinogen decarboxylase family protein [Candidatus Hydrogenedentota bacterium]